MSVELVEPPVAAQRKTRDPSRRVKAALQDLAQGKARLLSHRETPWASITFTGARHTLSFLFEDAGAIEAGETFIAELPEHEFALPGKLVAEATVISVEHALTPRPALHVECELLVLDDA